MFVDAAKSLLQLLFSKGEWSGYTARMGSDRGWRADDELIHTKPSSIDRSENITIVTIVYYFYYYYYFIERIMS